MIVLRVPVKASDLRDFFHVAADHCRWWKLYRRFPASLKKKKKNPLSWVLQRACNTWYLVLSEGLDTESTTLTPRRCVCMFLWCLLRPTCFPGHTMHRPIHHILYRGCQILVNGRLSISRVTAGHEIESEAEMCKTSEMVCVQ